MICLKIKLKIHSFREHFLCHRRKFSHHEWRNYNEINRVAGRIKDFLRTHLVIYLQEVIRML